MYFFIRKKLSVIQLHILLQTSCTYLFAYSGFVHVFYFRLLTFFKIKFFTNKPPGITIGALNSLDPDQDRRSDGHHLGSNCLQKAIGRRKKFSAGMQRVEPVKYLSVQYIIQYR